MEDEDYDDKEVGHRQADADALDVEEREGNAFNEGRAVEKERLRPLLEQCLWLVELLTQGNAPDERSVLRADLRRELGKE